MSTAAPAKRKSSALDPDHEEKLRELGQRVAAAEQLGERLDEDAIAAKQRRKEAADAQAEAAAARKKSRLQFQTQQAELQAQLKRVNEANAEKIDRGSLDSPGVLYNLNRELAGLVADNKRRMAVVKCLQGLDVVQEVAAEAAQLAYG